MQLYNLYFADVLMPVTPEEISMKIKGQNKTINLINQSEVNVIKPAGLTEINLSLLFPNTTYPFAQYKDGVFNGANYYLDALETLKNSKKPFQFILCRKYPDEKALYNTNLTVTLEEYSIKESYDNGIDAVVSVTLKQYVEYGTKTAVIKNNKKAKKSKTRSNSSKKKAVCYIVKKGDTLWKIAKKFLGDGNKCWAIAKLNGIANPNKIYVGQKLLIEGAASSSNSSSNSSTKRKTSTGKTTRSTNSQTSKKTDGTWNSGLAGISKVMDDYYNAQRKNKTQTGSTGYKPYQGYSPYTYYMSGGTQGAGSTTHQSSSGRTHGGGSRTFGGGGRL